jgi:hypothetical protein
MSERHSRRYKHEVSKQTEDIIFSTVQRESFPVTSFDYRMLGKIVQIIKSNTIKNLEANELQQEYPVLL